VPIPAESPSAPAAGSVDLSAILREARVTEALEQLDRELVGLVPVKTRLREIAAFLAVEKARSGFGMVAGAPSLHMSFTGNPGTGKTTVALRMAEILHRLGFVRKGHLIAVTRDDLVGQYIGHTAPKTKEVLKRAMGGVLFIDEAYYLYRPENERDYGQEAIEILLQVMENQRDDLVVILAGYKERMDTFFRSNPGFSSRIAHHIDFPDYSAPSSAASPTACSSACSTASMRKQRRPSANTSSAGSVCRTSPMPARSATRSTVRACARRAACVPCPDPVDAAALSTITAQDIRASRVFCEHNNRSD
jgi:probable Rubsico expression protein CbbX